MNAKMKCWNHGLYHAEGILSKITKSPFLALMVDEITDILNKEQLVFVIRTDADFSVHEDFLNMHEIKHQLSRLFYYVWEYRLQNFEDSTMMVKFSPKRNAILNSIKEEVGGDALSVYTLCSTRWIVCAQSTASILVNYKNIQDLWDEALEGSLDSEEFKVFLARWRPFSSFWYAFSWNGIQANR